VRSFDQSRQLSVTVLSTRLLMFAGMPKHAKRLRKILGGAHDQTIRFTDLAPR
jgi:hypothetical protein